MDNNTSKIIKEIHSKSYHKLRIIIALNLYQWTVLPEEKFPLLSNTQKTLVTFYKNNTAITMQIACIDKGLPTQQNDTPLTISGFNHTTQQFQTIYSATAKCFKFKDDYSTMVMEIGKYRNKLEIHLPSGNHHITLKKIHTDRYADMRDAIATFANKHDRLPTYHDIQYIRINNKKYFKNKQAATQSLTDSTRLNQAVAAGYLQKIRHISEVNGLIRNRLLFLPLFPEIHPPSTDKYERKEPWLVGEIAEKLGEIKKLTDL